jgi:hypothetical protein
MSELSTHSISFGTHSYLVDNSDFVRCGLPRNKDSSYVEISGTALSTIGYDQQGLDLFLDQIETKYPVKIARISFHNDCVQKQYDPSINLMNREFNLEDIVARINELIESIYSGSASNSYQLLTLSFSKMYLTAIGPRQFLAHVSPLVISKIQDKMLLFIFDEAAYEIAKKLIDLNQVVCVYQIKNLIYSPLNCNVFSVSIIKQFARDPEMVEYIFEKNPTRQRVIAVPLLPPYLPSKLMRFSESIKDKLNYLSSAAPPLLNDFIDVEDVLQSQCAKVCLVRVKGLLITAQEKIISTFLYHRNIQCALRINQHEFGSSQFQMELNREHDILSEKALTINDCLTEGSLFLSPPHVTSVENSSEQSNQYRRDIKQQMMQSFFQNFSSLPFLSVSKRNLPEGFCPFAEAYTLDSAHQLLSFFDFVDNFRCPPIELLNPEHYKVPLRGLMHLIGVSRSIADINALEEYGQSIGFVWVKNEFGEIVGAQTVKVIDGAYPFIFEKRKEQRCTHNLFTNTQLQLGSSSMWLKDIRDIQTEAFSTSRERLRVIEWKNLLSIQQEEFKEGMSVANDYIQRGDLVEDLELNLMNLELIKADQQLAVNWIEEQIKIYF